MCVLLMFVIYKIIKNCRTIKQQAVRQNTTFLNKPTTKIMLRVLDIKKNFALILT